MAEKMIIVCDNCGKEIEDKKNVYNIVLKSMAQWHDVYDHDYNYIAIELCSTCSKRLISSLENIIANFGLKK
jgi:ribosomal protein S26